jgi:hypothetical protein
MTSPSDLLVAAADRIRDLAAAATPGVWIADRHYVDSMPEPDVRALVCVVKSDSKASDDAQWVAALSPAVAPTIEKWLRDVAREMSEYGVGLGTGDLSNWNMPDYAWAALDLAKLICPELVEEDQK